MYSILGFSEISGPQSSLVTLVLSDLFFIHLFALVHTPPPRCAHPYLLCLFRMIYRMDRCICRCAQVSVCALVYSQYIYLLEGNVRGHLDPQDYVHVYTAFQFVL